MCGLKEAAPSTHGAVHTHADFGWHCQQCAPSPPSPQRCSSRFFFKLLDVTGLHSLMLWSRASVEERRALSQHGESSFVRCAGRFSRFPTRIAGVAPATPASGSSPGARLRTLPCVGALSLMKARAHPLRPSSRSRRKSSTFATSCRKRAGQPRLAQARPWLFSRR